ncbi:MAG: PRC-barrel domain-containing protein [bacterium]|nr:PRC-barrel domain-containing protein [bacterium]
MQVRFSTCLGMEVVEEPTQEVLGTLSGILIHPDSGGIEGIFVSVSGFSSHQQLFCVAHDILSIGTVVSINSASTLCDPMEIFRLEPILTGCRPILGQTITTESGQRLGTCRDVQFETESMQLQWLFPKKWWRWIHAVPAHSIVEVTIDTITVRDRASPIEEVEIDVTTALEKFQEPLKPS